MTVAVPRRSSLTLAVLCAALALVALAPAAYADVAPKLRAPGEGKTLAVGSEPIFKVLDRGQAYQRKVWLTISSSKKRDRYGQLKRGKFGTFTSMTRKRGALYTYQPEDFTFPEWFMNRAGTYYWQAFHINCDVSNSSRNSCNVYSRVRSFVVG